MLRDATSSRAIKDPATFFGYFHALFGCFRSRPLGVGKENSPDPDDPDAAPIVDLGDSRIESDPAYKDSFRSGRQTLTRTRGARAAAGKPRTAIMIARISSAVVRGNHPVRVMPGGSSGTSAR
jgi:hypothetical protein